MPNNTINKIIGSTPAILSRILTISGEGRQLANEEISARDFVETLTSANLETDAIQFLAYALPKREAVWWACLAVRDNHLEIKTQTQDALLAIESWVYQPSDEKRRAIFPLIEDLGFDTAASYAGMAAFWSGGSIAPLAEVTIEPDPRLSPTAAAAAVMLSAAISPIVKKQQQLAIKRGLNIAQGGNGVDLSE